MKKIHIFGLQSLRASFQIGPYHFDRVSDYDEQVKRLPQSETLRTNWNSETGEKIDTRIPGRRGDHACTYIATVDGEEPGSNLFEKDTPQLIDIVFLMRLLSGQGVYLEHELETFPARFKGELLIHDPFFIDEIGCILSSVDWLRAKNAGLGPSLYYYFRSCTSDMINFSGADIAIAWNMLASAYAAAYPPDGKEKFLEEKSKACEKLKPVLAEIGKENKGLAARISGALGSVSFDHLGDQVSHLTSSVGLLGGLDHDRVMGRLRTCVSHIRARLVHSGIFPDPKTGWTHRAQRYAVPSMRILFVLTCARLLGVKEAFYPFEEQLKTIASFFGDENPDFRGEHPFSEENSRFEERLRAASIESSPSV